MQPKEETLNYIELHFMKGKSFLDKIIGLTGWATHVAIKIGSTYYEAYPFVGCRKIQSCDHPYKGCEVKVIKLECNTANVKAMLDSFCNGSYDYDFLGALTCWTPWRREHPDKWFCSEFAASIARSTKARGCIKKEDHVYYPERLFKALEHHGYTKTYVC